MTVTMKVGQFIRQEVPYASGFVEKKDFSVFDPRNFFLVFEAFFFFNFKFKLQISSQVLKVQIKLHLFNF